jgi:hypothetical protein
MDAVGKPVEQGSGEPLAAQTLDPSETVDDFQAIPGQDARGAAIGFDCTGGVLFSAGFAVTSSDGTSSAIVNRSRDGGDNWDVVDQFSLQPGASGSYNAFASDGGDAQLYVVGGIFAPVFNDDAWVISDDYPLSPGKPAAAGGIAVNPSWGVSYGYYATGYARDGSGVLHWITRKLAP